MDSSLGSTLAHGVLSHRLTVRSIGGIAAPFLFATLLTACVPSALAPSPTTVSDEQQYAMLYPYYAEICALSQLDKKPGFGAKRGFLEESPEQWREMVMTNVYGTALVARAVLPALVAHRGHLVLTGSVAGRVTIPGQLYSATKWAVTAMAQSIRAEATTTGIRVTLIQPGLVDTSAASPHRHADPKLEPQDIARTVLFALEQPKTVDINEIVVRPTGQSPQR